MLNKKYIIALLVFSLVITLVSTVEYTPPVYNDINFSLCQGYTAPIYNDINFTLDDSNPCVTDTCTYSGSGTWAVNCADNCSITETVNLAGEDITIIGHGTFSTTADINNAGDILMAGDSSTLTCEVSCNGGCFN